MKYRPSGNDGLGSPFLLPSRPATHRAPSALLALGLALLPLVATARQAPPTGGPTGPSTPSTTRKVADLTSRYRFSEIYTTEDRRPSPGLVGAYRVAIVEVVKDSVDTPQGAPRRTESSRQVIFTERPAEMGATGTVASVARSFERYRPRPEEPSRSVGIRPLDGLSVLIRPRPGEPPQVLSLTPGRWLTEQEYEVVARQVFVPQLASILPAQVVRVGDTWRIGRKAVQAMLGDPSIQGDTLTGKLTEVRKEIDGPRLVASIAITGRVNGPSGDTRVNAEALFTFQPESSPKPSTTRPSSPARPVEDVVESRGAITELRLASVTSGPLPGPGRLRFQSTREVTLHRQLELAAGAVAPPKVAKPPEPTEANAWLVHVDPLGRYAFRHPQDLLAPDRAQATPEPRTTLLIRTRREGRDMLQVEFHGKTLAPDDLKKELAEKYQVLKMEVIQGEESWLPEADWPRMRVHRVDAEVKVADPKATSTIGSTRIHFDGYLIQFGQSSSVLAIASTSRDAVAAYRREVEQILKSIQLDPPRPPVE